MYVRYLAGIVDAALLVVSYNSSNELSTVGRNTCIMGKWPDAECQLVNATTGKRSNRLSGQHGKEGGPIRDAMSDLRNQMTAVGDNTTYGISNPSQEMLSGFVSTDSQIIGQAHKRPNRCGGDKHIIAKYVSPIRPT